MSARRFGANDTVDFIVVGSRAAGGVMARELSQAGFDSRIGPNPIVWSMFAPPAARDDRRDARDLAAAGKGRLPHAGRDRVHGRVAGADRTESMPYEIVR